MTAHESGQSFHEVRSSHSRPMSITSQQHDHDDNTVFDMDVEDNETKRFEVRAMQIEPQQKQNLHIKGF